MTGLTFDPAGHVYTLDGVQVPSVTGILKACGLIDFSRIPSHILDAARERGTVVHAAVHALNDRDLDISRFVADFPEYAGYLKAWQSFLTQRNFVPVLNEHRVASCRYQLAGTIDCLGWLDGAAVLLDFATGRPHDVAKNLQTSAYQALAAEWARDGDIELQRFLGQSNGALRRFAVSLRRDGSFRLEGYADHSDFRKFRTLREAQQIVDEHRGERIEVAA